MRTLSEIFYDVKFRFVQPHMPCENQNLRLMGRDIPFDVINTDLGPESARIQRLFAPILGIPRMSTIAVAYYINEIVARMPPDSAFVNVGVWQGFTYFAGLLGNADRECIGVDNFSQFGGPKHEFLGLFKTLASEKHSFFERDYREYFKEQHRSPIGCYIYDGEHSYNNQLLGLSTAEPFLVPGSFILVDDTNLEDARKATLDFLKARPGKYNVLLDLCTSGNGHPTYWNGVMVMQRTEVP